MSLAKQQGPVGLPVSVSKEVEARELGKSIIICNVEPYNPEGSDDDSDSDSDDDSDVDCNDLEASDTGCFRPRGSDTYKKVVGNPKPTRTWRLPSFSSSNSDPSRSRPPNQRYPPGLPPPPLRPYPMQPSSAPFQSYPPSSDPQYPTRPYQTSSQSYSQSPAVASTSSAYHRSTHAVSVPTWSSPQVPAASSSSHQGYNQNPVAPSSQPTYQHTPQQAHYSNPPSDQRYNQRPVAPSGYPIQHAPQPYRNPSLGQGYSQTSQTQSYPTSSNIYGTAPPLPQTRKPSRPYYRRFDHD
ncbi:hypothetical protein SERLA73DRAFT_69793 [Serpula lacrymans var. lacrymans S7.3]|uniref:Uncharacterized protein n=1 Tax=Serpula lacrymans var. lacrymans (strain S7.3) TaxID=936435 RepID=F8PL87_SERL3|nr:hypothetical protein SERLA73DRAFT_69793 [Serpula lacrymans var. lacrymans S7.3]